MAHSIRTKFQLQSLGLTEDSNSNYNKQIYIKNRNWHPNPAPSPIEDQITNFDKALRQQLQTLILKHKKTNLRNLTRPQSLTLRRLKENKSFVIKPTDKNLGPAIMDTETYVKQVLTEHLLTKDYKKLTKESARIQLDNIKAQLKSFITQHQTSLTKEEITYFQRSYKSYHRIPIFYGLPKVHKIPMTLRPVVSTSSSFLSIFSNWLDFKMKELLPSVKSYLMNSTTLLNDLRHITLPEDALLFTADAKSMYTNIDTTTGVTAIREFISSNIENIPINFPTTLFLQVLQCVMENNIFSFGETYWLQLSGTAMGTPAACAYATISYGHHENTSILPSFKSQLLYYKRYIDDIFGIWIPPRRNCTETWYNFKKELNNWGRLEWVTEEPTTTTTFLDLNISISHSKIHTSTFQKEMNLYLYIPPSSSHPPSCFKGLLTGELKRYYIQNNSEDFENILLKFINRLIDRGHSLDKLKPLLMQAATAIDSQFTPSNKTETDNPSTLYIHWTYHPHGIQRHDLRKMYHNTLKDDLPFDRMQVAVSRPKNLRDILSKAKLELPQGLNIEQYIQKYSKHTSTDSS
jgi:hypothetical protein